MSLDSPRFGLEVLDAIDKLKFYYLKDLVDVDDQNKIPAILRILKNHPPVKSRMEAIDLLKQAYDLTFGIFDHIEQARKEAGYIANNTPRLVRPLATVALHPVEKDTDSVRYLKSIITAFNERRISEMFGISFVEFMNMPVEYANLLMAESRRSIAADERQKK